MKQLLTGMTAITLFLGVLLAPVQATESYCVKQGDSLSTIALGHHIGVSDLIKANNLQNPHRLKLGMVLQIPSGSSTSILKNRGSRPLKTANKSNLSSGYITYTVQQTDNLWSIAHKFQVSYKTIARANGLTKPEQLKLGMTLRIPRDSVPTVAVSSPQPTVRPHPLIAAVAPQIERLMHEPTYTVKSGDSIWTIARKYQVSWKEIAHINGLSKPEKLKLNMTLKIPIRGFTPVPQSTVATSKSTPGVVGAHKIRSAWAEVQKDRVIVRSQPTDGERITIVDRWTKVQVGSYNNGWHRVRMTTGQVGWVRSDLLTPTKAPAQTKPILIVNVNKRHRNQIAYEGRSRKVASVERPQRRWAKLNRSSVRYTRRGNGRPEEIPGTTRTSVVAMALSYRGTPYRYGGSSPRAFDCSGFTQYVYSKAGKRLPRTATQQSRVGRNVGINNLQEGDLVTFHTTRGKRIGHVGIYIGNGQFVHASSGGGRVRVDTLRKGYYKGRFVTGTHLGSAAKKAKIASSSETKKE